MIGVSCAFYAPVILFAAQAPMPGMRMIPKTLACVAIAIIGYCAYYMDEAAGVELAPAD